MLLKPSQRGKDYGRRYQPVNGITTYPDGREVCNKAAWERRKREMWGAWIRAGVYPRCHLCGGLIYDFSEFSPDHIITRGMGGSKRDDRLANLRPSHLSCNIGRGSRKL